MNTRERFLATMNFEPLDRPLYWEFGYWAPTIRRWYREGLPCVAGISDSMGDDATIAGQCIGIDWRIPDYDRDVKTALGLDEYMYRIPINNLFLPEFKEEILEDHKDWFKIRDMDGQVVEISRLNGSRRHLEAPVKTRADYERLKEERFQSNLQARLPANWPEVKENLKQRTVPLEYGGMLGFFNHPRRLLGFERLMMAFCTEPDLVKQIINDTAEMMIALYDPILSELGGECGLISEDMSYKCGCFISPEMFREFMMPAYKKMTGFYRDHGITTILVDSDGDVMNLIPLLIEGGVTGLYPFEVTGRCDIVEVRRSFPRFQILGGIGKKIVAQGRGAIDRELEYKVPELFKTGGFIPFIDHTVPPDISWDNFCYYRERLAELANSQLSCV